MARPCIHSPRQQPDPAVPAPKHSQLPGGTGGAVGSCCPTRAGAEARAVGQGQPVHHPSGQRWSKRASAQEGTAKGLPCITLDGSVLLVINPALRLEGDTEDRQSLPGAQQVVPPVPPMAPTASQSCPKAQAAGTGVPTGTGAVPCKPCRHHLGLDTRGDQRGPVNSGKDPKHPLSSTQTPQGPRPPPQPGRGGCPPLSPTGCVLSSPQPAPYILHEFALGSFRAEANEVVGTQHPLRVLVLAQGTCHAEERFPFAGTQYNTPCPAGVLGAQLSPAAPFPFSSLLPQAQIPTGHPVPLPGSPQTTHCALPHSGSVPSEVAGDWASSGVQIPHRQWVGNTDSPCSPRHPSTPAAHRACRNHGHTRDSPWSWWWHQCAGRDSPCCCIHLWE